MTGAGERPIRFAIGVAYDGGDYHGWQRQRDPAVPTVQGVLEPALSAIAGGPIALTCAGRTDAGVHAIAQVCHFDAPEPRPTQAWILGSAAHLPPRIRVGWAVETSATFHARFSARARRYRYVILNRPTPSALLAGRVCWRRRALDVRSMNSAAAVLVGEHDFSSFRAAGCQSRTPMRRVERIEVRASGDLVIVDVTANAFLLHMVRNIVGALMALGESDGSAAAATEQLRAWLALRDRTKLPPTAPAAGLTLVGVDYPDVFGLPDSGEVRGAEQIPF